LFFQALFKPKPAKLAGEALYASAVAQARRPEFYTGMGAPDTLEGRFELYTLHVVLLILRLKGQGNNPSAAAQALFDAYLQSLDIALREMGVGDLSVGKKMKKLGRAFYGRVRSYDAAQAAPGELDDLIRRTVYEGAPDIDSDKLVRYALAARESLAEQPMDRLLAGEAAWPEPLA
jgi:cytochrome b pre-mRNA-processing protein 3